MSLQIPLRWEVVEVAMGKGRADVSAAHQGSLG